MCKLLEYEDDSDDGYSIDFGPCIEKNKKTGETPMWGCPERKPCVFLKLADPKPKKMSYYTNATVLPDDMPSDLKTYIKENPDKKVRVRSSSKEWEVESLTLRSIFGINFKNTFSLSSRLGNDLGVVRW